MTLSVDERDELRSAARGVLTREAPPERLWADMVELGWTSIHVPEASGGAGAGFAELGVVLIELGRALTPSPFLASAVLATAALRSAANDVTAPGLASLVAGEAVGSVALAGVDGSYEWSRVTAEWDGARLHGASGFVLDADVADVLVVAARHTDGAPVALAVDTRAAGLRVEHVPTVDPTRRLFTVSFDGVAVGDDALLCDPGRPAEELLDGVLATGVIAAMCDTTGAAEHMLEQATTYAKERTQFGKPIGSFQAVKHYCANMAIAVEASRAAVRAACDALDGDSSEWSRAASVTSSFVGPACASACALGLRVHGGIGFTWEHDSHRYLKRAKLDEVLFGTTSWHRRRLADAVFSEVARR